jgi:hypothetical protein
MLCLAGRNSWFVQSVEGVDAASKQFENLDVVAGC